MKFWVIHAQENPPETSDTAGRRQWRSNTLAETLAARGHQVIRWRSAFSHQEKRKLTNESLIQTFENYKIQYIDCPEYKRHIGVSRVRNHRALARNFLSLAARGPRPDLIHVCNVPIELCEAAVRFGVEHKIPVIVDVRDLWPDIYVDFVPISFQFLKPLAKAYFDRCSPKVAYSFRNATAITALTDSYLNWGLAKANRERNSLDRVFPMCYPKVEREQDPAALTRIRIKLGLQADSIVACYIGNIGYQSDFETVVNAARQLADDRPNLKFVFAGSGPRREHLEKLARELPNVVVPGWLLSSEVRDLMSIATFGLIAYKSVPNFMLNLPNKFSEYLAGGLAVACGIEGEMGALVRKHKCGFVYQEGDSVSLAKQLELILRSQGTVGQMMQASAFLHADRFDGSKIFGQFAANLEEIAVSNTRSAAA